MLKQHAPATVATPQGLSLVLEEYFLGATRAWGIFQDRFGNLKRQFKVEMNGVWDGRELTLTEDFAYDDGTSERRVWRIRRQGAKTYQAVADDVVGVVIGTVEGHCFSAAYDFRLRLGTRALIVRLDERMYLQDDRTLINRARMSKFGLEIGQISIFFRKI